MTTDTVDQIFQLFARDSNGQLDAAATSDIRVAIRISGEFCDFVAKFGGTAPQPEVEYMMNTIRSGIDEFYSIAVLHRVLEHSGTSSKFEWIEERDWGVLGSIYQTRFRALQDPSINFAERLENLLSLCQSQLLFLARSFKLMV